MKIFYAVQATGNGHISRAMELLPHLQRYGSVDIFLSGDNSNLLLDAPVKYRSKGISLYYNRKGGLNYWHTVKQLRPVELWEEIRDLPVEKYDLVLNDFDFITGIACARKKIPSVHFGHQASFQSDLTPRPAKKSLHGEWLLKNYVKAAHHTGFHFESYDENIFGAVVKQSIIDATPVDKGHITVYLPSWCEAQLQLLLQALPAFRFEVFSRETTTIHKEKNVLFIPVNKELFNKSLIGCTGIICGAGFETPAEALQLGKKIMAIPIRGQYEQQCNAAALERLGVTCLASAGQQFKQQFYKWIQAPAPAAKDYSRSIPQCLEHIFSLAESSMMNTLLAEEILC